MSQRIWVTSDWHFNHSNLLKGLSTWTSSLPPREFASTDDMNDAIIDNINAVVEPQDILWNLGDVIMGGVKDLPALRARIKCQNIHLILGNHDKAIKEHRINDAGKRVPGNKLGACFADVRWYKSIRIPGHEFKAYLFHCPMHTWPGINKGFLQIHGHCHGNLPDRKLRQADVGIDAHGFKPVLLDKLVADLMQRQLKDMLDIPKDHHSDVADEAD